MTEQLTSTAKYNFLKTCKSLATLEIYQKAFHYYMDYLKVGHEEDDKETFLVEESIGKRLKDMAIFFATIIPVAIAVIQLLLQRQ